MAAGEAVTSVNGQSGDVTLDAADGGAADIRGTMTGPLNAKDFVICDGTLYPSVDFKADFEGNYQGASPGEYGTKYCIFSQLVP